MKSKTSLVLMEQLIMVLIFAMAAALCLQGFIKAEQMSVHISRRDEAVWIAQNTAELLKAGEEPESAFRDSDLTVDICETASEINGLRQAQIYVYDDGELLFSLETGWQEVRQ